MLMHPSAAQQLQDRAVELQHVPRRACIDVCVHATTEGCVRVCVYRMGKKAGRMPLDAFGWVQKSTRTAGSQHNVAASTTSDKWIHAAAPNPSWMHQQLSFQHQSYVRSYVAAVGNSGTVHMDVVLAGVGWGGEVRGGRPHELRSKAACVQQSAKSRSRA